MLYSQYVVVKHDYYINASLFYICCHHENCSNNVLRISVRYDFWDSRCEERSDEAIQWPEFVEVAH
ncbi:Uncharacterised protein [Legionella pneumophila]|nr:Uncharacterised protein [Legionella pneumophila]CZH33056.1 Uncharacterised protein [Legionella pneumophila]CZH58237.1 Uncharacterised protein [Legionella pneumophila]